MTGIGRIRWKDEPGETLGYIGTFDSPAFRIWPPGAEGDRVLLVYLAGAAQHMYHDDSAGSLNALKAKAEELLGEFVSSLGAIFPEDEDEPEFEEFDEEQFRASLAPGRRVRFSRLDTGYPADQEMAAALLAPGEVYTIAWSDIGFASSRLGLAGIKDHGQGFNSVLFEPVPPAPACPVCKDTGTVISPDLDGESSYESDCPEPVHREAVKDAGL